MKLLYIALLCFVLYYTGSYGWYEWQKKNRIGGFCVWILDWILVVFFILYDRMGL